VFWCTSQGKVPQGSRRFRRVAEGSERFRCRCHIKVPEGSGGFREGSGKFWCRCHIKVPEGAVCSGARRGARCRRVPEGSERFGCRCHIKVPEGYGRFRKVLRGSDADATSQGCGGFRKVLGSFGANATSRFQRFPEGSEKFRCRCHIKVPEGSARFRDLQGAWIFNCDDAAVTHPDTTRCWGSHASLFGGEV